MYMHGDLDGSREMVKVQVVDAFAARIWLERGLVGSAD
jgi:hypothetical protein